MKHLGAKITVLCALVLALVLAVAPAQGGLGLGEARVESFLGQALSTRISLLEPSEQALETLTVEIASAEDHARLGVPVDSLGLGLRVELDRRLDPPALRLTSTRPVNEPFLQVLVSARWSGGRMLREYTLFLDPPTVPVAPPLRRVGETAAPLPAAEPRHEPPAVAAEPEPSPPASALGEGVVEPATRVEGRVQERLAPATPSTVGPVRAGQTLWSIAEAWRPDDSVTMNQVLLAILERNPQAFAGGNVNRLMRGAELVMPDLSAVRAVPQDEALRRIREQNAAWQAERDRMRATAARSAAVVEPIQPVVQPEPMSMPEQEPVSAPQPEPAPAIQADAALEVTEDSALADPEPLPEADDPALPRLELTAADDTLLTDTQALGAERERLEDRLGSLVQELRSDGLDTPAMNLEVDQIRQAIASNDAGGLMIASEGLAELEQQLREIRAEREAQAPMEVIPVTEPEVGAADGSSIFRFAWLLGALLLALFLALAVALVIFRRRRATAAAQRAAAAPVAVPATPALAERRALEADSLDAGLAELYRLAEEEDHAAFGSVLSDFHAQLETTDDPRWREALTLARVLVPGHPLLREIEDLESAAVEGRETEEAAELGLEALLADPDEGSESHSAAPGDLELDNEPDDALSRLLDEQDEDAEDVDIARLANRLDPEDADQARKEESESEDEELANLFRREPSAPPTWQLDAEDDGPLELDFDFSSRRESLTADETAGESPSPDLGQPDVPSSPEGDDQPDKLTESDLLADPGFDAPLSDEDLLSPEHDWFELGDEPDADVEPEAGEVAKEDLEPVAVSEVPAGDERVAVLSDDDAEVKLDLARAYLSMDDVDSARALLEEVVNEGSDTHRAQAQQLIEGLK